MLIAIMGDEFDYATEHKINNRTLGMLKIMGEYVHLTVEDGDIEKFSKFVVNYQVDDES